MTRLLLYFSKSLLLYKHVSPEALFGVKHMHVVDPWLRRLRHGVSGGYDGGSQPGPVGAWRRSWSHHHILIKRIQPTPRRQEFLNFFSTAKPGVLEKASGRGLQRCYVRLRLLQDSDVCGPPEETQHEERRRAMTRFIPRHFNLWLLYCFLLFVRRICASFYVCLLCNIWFFKRLKTFQSAYFSVFDWHKSRRVL